MTDLESAKLPHSPNVRGETPGANDRRPLRDTVYDQIRELIISLKLSPGMLLVEADLTARLRVSRTPVRQALQRLQREGFVVPRRPHTPSRVIVAPMTIEDMEELHEILGALESLAARAAAGLPPGGRCGFADQLTCANEALREAWKSGPASVRRAQDCHVEFHRTFARMARTPRLKSQLEALQSQVERYERVYTASLGDGFAACLREHDAVARAIAAGDADAAEQAARNNWLQGSERYTKLAQSMGERGHW